MRFQSWTLPRKIEEGELGGYYLIMNFENILINLIFGLLLLTVILAADIVPPKNIETRVLGLEGKKEGGLFSPAKPGKVLLNSDSASSDTVSENLLNEWAKGSAKNFAVFFALFFLTLLLIHRWIESGHPPLSNLYESLLFLTWTFLVFYIRMDANPGSRSEPGKADMNVQQKRKSAPGLHQLIGFLFLATALFFYTFATWLLPSQMQTVSPLVPALQSNWLLMHVSIMLLSYSSLLAGSLCSITYLFVLYFLPSDDPGRPINETEVPTKVLSSVPPPVSPDQGLEKKSSGRKLLDDLDQYSSRSLSFAFPLLTLGIISGAVWANEAWGSYWSWDPKETWAFITWLLFAIYLHVRFNKGWAGEKAAWVATFGFFMIWICYLGVNLLGKGLHSYGWWER